MMRIQRYAYSLFVIMAFFFALCACASTPIHTGQAQKNALTAPTPFAIQTPVSHNGIVQKSLPIPIVKKQVASKANDTAGYTFAQGKLIYQPVTDFCLHFHCIPNFGNGHGYVLECNDLLFSKSGGIKGSCSGHKGNWRTLYAH